MNSLLQRYPAPPEVLDILKAAFILVSISSPVNCYEKAKTRSHYRLRLMKLAEQTGYLIIILGSQVMS